LRKHDMDHVLDCKMLVVPLRHLATKGQRGLAKQLDRGTGETFGEGGAGDGLLARHRTRDSTLAAKGAW
jgi:hypothetical protein